MNSVPSNRGGRERARVRHRTTKAKGKARRLHCWARLELTRRCLRRVMPLLLCKIAWRDNIVQTLKFTQEGSKRSIIRLSLVPINQSTQLPLGNTRRGCSCSRRRALQRGRGSSRLSPENMCRRNTEGGLISIPDPTCRGTETYESHSIRTTCNSSSTFHFAFRHHHPKMY